MLTLTPKSWLSWDFRVTTDGEEIALIDRHWYRERASFTIDGNNYEVYRTSLVRSAFVLEHSGVVLAEAKKPSAFRRSFVVTVGANRYDLRAASMFGRQFNLLQGGVVVGTIRPMSWLRRTATAQFPERMPREAQLFMVFLVLILWKRQADEAAS